MRHFFTFVKRNKAGTPVAISQTFIIQVSVRYPEKAAIPHLYFKAATEDMSVHRLQSDPQLRVCVLRVFLLFFLSMIVFYGTSYVHFLIQPSCVDLSAMMGTETEAPVCLSSISLRLLSRTFCLTPSQSQVSIK